MERLGATENNECVNILCNQFLLFQAMQEVCNGSMFGLFLYLTFFFRYVCLRVFVCKGASGAEYPGVT